MFGGGKYQQSWLSFCWGLCACAAVELLSRASMSWRCTQGRACAGGALEGGHVLAVLIHPITNFSFDRSNLTCMYKWAEVRGFRVGYGGATGVADWFDKRNKEASSFLLRRWFRRWPIRRE